MKGGSWLCPTELDRSRVLEASPRVRTIRTVSSSAVGVALIAAAPWIGWWTLALFAASVLNFLNVERRIHTSPHPERVSACAIVITLLLLNGGVALTGGSASPMLSWTVLPVGMVAACFRPHVVIAGLVLTLVLMLITTVGVHPAAALHNPVPLIATLALLTAVVAIVWALQAAELHHRDEASVDPLTGLLNRHALAPRFIELCHQARLTRQPVCLVLCDIDNFKAINDEYGHDRGDAALRDVAYELRKRLRSFELAYRLGGEEFLVVLPGVDSDGGRLVAERLRAAVQQTRPAGIPITISIGVSAARGGEVDYDSLFKAADLALYEAKRAGRNRVMVTPDPAKAEPEAAKAEPEAARERRSHPRAALARW